MSCCLSIILELNFTHSLKALFHALKGSELNAVMFDTCLIALKFLEIQPFVTSVIIGATTMDQLKENIESINTELTQETLDRIDAIHATIPNPAP